MSCNEIGQPPEMEKRVTISRGDDYAFRATFRDSNNVAVNLSGWQFNIRCTKPGQSDVVFAVAIDGPNGTVTGTLTDTQSAAMVAGENISDAAGRWVLVVIGTDSAGLIRRYVRVPFVVLK